MWIELKRRQCEFKVYNGYQELLKEIAAYKKKRNGKRNASRLGLH